MEQSELNGILQKWLEGLHQHQIPFDQKIDFGPLPSEGDQELTNVLVKLATALRITGAIKTSLHAGGTHLAVLARSLSLYLSVALESRDVDVLAGTVHAHVANILLTLIGQNSINKPLASIYHDDIRDGFVRVFQMALFNKYDKMATEGLLSAATKPPVVYVGMRGEITILHHVCARVGLPPSCITPVACSTIRGSTHTIDVSALEKQINEDSNLGKTPLLVISYAGTPLAGHLEDLENLRRICDQFDMWLHVTGHGLSSLCLPEEKEEIKGFANVDSFTLFPGTWFGILSSPIITLHKHPKVINTGGVPNSTNFPGENPDLTADDYAIPQLTWTGLYPHGLTKLSPLPLWLCMQYLGSTALVDTVSYCRSLTKNMMIRLDEIPGITRLATPNHTSYVVLFKYNGSSQLALPPSLRKLLQPNTPPTPKQDVKAENKANEGQVDQPSSEPVKETPPTDETKETPPLPTDETKETPSLPTDETKETPPSSERKEVAGSQQEEDEPLVVTIHGMPLVITNMYNVMISKDLNSLFPKVGIATYDMGGKDGVIFRFDPITSFPEHSTSVEDIENFTEELRKKVETLHPIAQARCLFEVALRQHVNLRWLEFHNIHCVAIIQYVQTDYIDKKDLTIEEVNHLNSLNIELCRHLAQISPVFSPFQHGNFTCLLIRELPKNMSMFMLLETVITETAKFEDHKKELAGLEEKIREGIVAAQQDLNKEKEKMEQEESLLKYVPIVGSVVNWFYPTSPTGVTGRSFNLASGKIETSNSVYKHHMQLVEVDQNSSNSGGNLPQTTPTKTPKGAPAPPTVNESSTTEN